MNKTPNIRALDLTELKAYLLSIGEKGFRAQQIHDWLWKLNAASFEEMSNVRQALRTKLAADFVIGKLEKHSEQRSNDGTSKYAFTLPDGNLVEGVLIPTETRVTACVSSQIGCSLTCKFCATGYLDLKRNLHHWEIYDQVAYIRAAAEAEYGRPLTNIVYMGMGEPLLNYRNVLRSIAMITDENGMGMAPKRITVSTAGIAKMIRKLADDEVRFEFALSLHAANDTKRNEIMPINESNTLEALGEALAYFYEKQARVSPTNTSSSKTSTIAWKMLPNCWNSPKLFLPRSTSLSTTPLMRQAFKILQAIACTNSGNFWKNVVRL